ncbi:MAG TPA: hypothetical protein VHC47_01495 [Mucilaginibacter sp.]|nr:hypothetical protein [Mucilaginibacter sp.]
MFTSSQKTHAKWTAIALMIAASSFCKSFAQGTITYKCAAMNFSGTESLKSDPISEDDPNDLPECWGYLITYFPNDNNRFELRFPSRTGVYHWTQNSDQDKNDSLSAYLVYTLKVRGYNVQAYAKNFTIRVTRYDSQKGGTIEGTFEGTMEAFIASNNSNVDIDVKGNFQTIRTGKFGDECRKPRRAENKVIGNAKSVVSDYLRSPLQQMGWHVNGNDEMKTVISSKPSPFRPMGLCDDPMDMKLQLGANSEYGRMMADSAEYYSKLGTTEGALNMFRIQGMRALQIRVFVNDPYIKSVFNHGSSDKYIVLKVPGAGYACRFVNAPQSSIDQPQVATDLYFGNWAGANMNARDYVNYPFTHKMQSPYIENMRVEIDGPAQVVDDILKKIDWSKLNAALAK